MNELTPAFLRAEARSLWTGDQRESDGCKNCNRPDSGIRPIGEDGLCAPCREARARLKGK